MPDYKQFPLADTAEGLTEAEILNWHVQPGDEVQVNQIVVEVETAKAAVELPIPWSGVVTELHAEPGQTVEVGAPLLTLDIDPRGKAPAAGGANGSAPAAPSTSETAEAPAEEEMKPLVGYGSKKAAAKRRPRKPAAATASDGPSGAVNAPPKAPEPPAPAAPAPATNGTAPAGGYVPLAKPPVRKLAKELGVDLRDLAQRVDGVITREDVQRAAEGAAPEPAAAEPVAEPVLDPAARERRVPVKGVRKATATAMVQSAFSAPHVTEFLTVDVTPMMEMRERLKRSPAFAGVRLTPLAFAAKAVCLAVKRTPDVNAEWDEDTGEIVYKDYVHLGIAAATPRGLIVPKIRDADSMSLVELARALDELTTTAREGKTPPGDMVNGTITITNVGVFGVDTGTPIINPGETAILAFGAIRDTPWVVDGEITVRKVLQLALSFDHRVVDGQQGSQFLADVGALLADPSVAFTF
ncbi:pyruvate dehydrogenase E2 component (dihydrolipoamide acetyltransferase) [Amycolatopsis arida]|uniref:Dihydrolipoamide acetyltransferase component of pyruvate dehydrogenase complex n=1 Tax=Amycolatopsis arida TaxID=587909 RepID=A0A1I5TF14_9PSEU|nr:dihydrolipoamide acetyltransferase family protein [Amycolatopsis arida]TDX96120.1 pyruvate dehydrogenase E2 component (dihydrolipoamide acetyltransferase) [Amycolatopsis arida]SFP81634.1 pyruvate dehydrogenase E2 component (dihydrolipoamide acetyltransferase) [Amycolatopsis arida]